MAENFVPEFTEEELEENKATDNLIAHNMEWEKVPVIVKKRIWTRRMLGFEKLKGSMKLADGFSFDSDSKVKLYAY